MRALMVAVLGLVFSVEAGASEPASYSLENVPAPLQSAAARASQAIAQLRPRLLQMLTAALNEGGPAAAISCGPKPDEAGRDVGGICLV